MPIEADMEELNLGEVARRARRAAVQLATLDTATKNRALEAVRGSLSGHRDKIFAACRADKAEAERDVEAGSLSRALLRRLDIEGSKFEGVLAGIDDVISLEDPVGKVSLATRLDEGLDLYRVSCPLGVIGVIFEARPDAAVQIAALALKSANAIILKGGSEASRTNEALVAAIREALASLPEFPVDAVQLLSTREEVRALLDQDEYVDLIIPRGSNELVRFIQENTRIPVLGHADGICAVYIDRDSDVDTAVSVVVDSKSQYPAVCNAAETLLIHEDVLTSHLPPIAAALREKGVELRVDKQAGRVLGCTGDGGVAAGEVRRASEEDFDTEFLELIMAVRCVGSVDEAIEHINSHGSHHTDAIVTRDDQAAEYFFGRVDSAGVFLNASTRFADGFRFGLGAEVGVSTNKTHARGPVGLEGLVIYKYRLYGSGQGVAGYGPDKKPFLHEDISKQLPRGS